MESLVFAPHLPLTFLARTNDTWSGLCSPLLSTKGWSTVRSKNFKVTFLPWELSSLRHQILPQSIRISCCSLHTIAKHISRPQDIPAQFPFVRQQKQIQNSGTIYCPSLLCAQPMFFELNTPAQSADGQTGIFHPTGSLLALLSSGDRGWSQP